MSESSSPGQSSQSFVPVTCVVNGRTVTRVVPSRMHVIDFLRTEMGLTGSHVACEHGACGACTVRVDGDIVRGCLMLAAQLDGSTLTTIEGVTDTGEIADLQKAFVDRNALQCGYCTAGMLLCAAEFIERRGTADRAAIREFISGNYCRCTGYHAIVDAIADTVTRRREAKRGER
jgi:carbon-monoxide dehydrogenase small subunit